jgi:hypothetical protein
VSGIRLFTTAYWPPVSQMMAMTEASFIEIEGAENFQKQSYRNRMKILSANGVQSLSIPVANEAPKMSIQEVKIDYKTNWQQSHWRSLEAAYNTSPFFFYYKDMFHDFYFSKKHPFLFEYNMELLSLVFKILSISPQRRITEEYSPKTSENTEDLRSAFHPKQISPLIFSNKLKPYPQVFDQKFGFTPDLSILDVICNLGPEAKGITTQI